MSVQGRYLLLAASLLTVLPNNASATVRYVDVNSTSPTLPYTNWGTAAVTILDAVDAAVAGDLILVTNGVYQTGGRVVGFGSLTNRVVVNKAVTVQSVNGPAVTQIKGFQVPGIIHGENALRCAYLTNGAILVGFTLAGGATLGATGVFGPDQTGGGVLCESASAVLSNCVLAGNAAYNAGGGANSGTLKNCTLSSNSAAYGGGANYATLNNCILSGNSASYGGGADSATLNNCTLIANSATNSGGGAYGATMNNCILYFNTASGDANYYLGTLNYCCTTPLPDGGQGNFTVEPQLASQSHLSTGSPCRSAGTATHASGVDIDGETWANPPSVGCDEYHTGVVTGSMSVTIEVGDTNVIEGLELNFAAQIGGRVSASRWDFGDGTVVSNRPYASHSWTTMGDYTVLLWAYNETYSNGINAAVAVHVAERPVYYVASGSTSPTPPYTNWTTAATTIQDAIDVAGTGALVLVSNGIYRTGGRAVFGMMTNRVAVTKRVILRSVNGPDVTIIEGFQVPGVTNGNAAVRCVYLTNRAELVGFTLTNGATLTGGQIVEVSGGGVLCASSTALVSNCVIIGNSCGSDGGGVYGGSLQFCRIEKNRAGVGGGARGSELSECVIADNLASDGGGLHSVTATNCTIISNSAGNGAGSYAGLLVGCILSSNSAASYFGGRGGGLHSSTGLNCVISWNSSDFGGGAYGGTLNNCALFGNRASDSGGGVTGGTINNCNLTGNFAGSAGGASGGILNNTVIYHNSARSNANYDGNFGSSMRNCCTTPRPTSGAGNITSDPQLASALHLSGSSPCIGAGSAAYSSGMDIDGELWKNPPSIGCDEYHSGSITGLLSVALQASYTNVAAGFLVGLRADILGHASANRWELGDGTVVSNRPNFCYSWAAAGNYPVVLRVYNESYPGGISTTSIVHVLERPIHYVALGSANPLSPYTSWANAATNFQDAVDAAYAGGMLLVTNGIYDVGGRAVYGALTNRVAAAKPLSLSSVNGPNVTVIKGVPGSVRCVYLGSDSRLVGFTLLYGGTSSGAFQGPLTSGGGVCCESMYSAVENCIILSNSAGFSGGGAYRGTLNDCTLIGNVSSCGGGTSYNTLGNCTVSSNSATVGGGAYSSTLSNCTLSGNSALSSGGGAYGALLKGCTLSGNRASTSSGLGAGGGADSSLLDKCVVVGNTSGGYGGGASSGTATQTIFRNNTAVSGGGTYNCTLTNCTLVGNFASSIGGGAYYGALDNCIIYYNSSTNGSNVVDAGIFHCCTTPLAFFDARNFTNAPQFVNLAGGDLRLLPDSPCINAGINSYAPNGTDLAGNPRIVGGTVDLGAYEYQTPGSVISYAYLERFGLQTDGSVDFLDLDGDGFNTWQEWQAWTDPTDAQDFLHLLTPSKNASSLSLKWKGTRGRLYYIERAVNLTAQPAFLLLRTNIPGPSVSGDIVGFIDNTATNSQAFYRLGVYY